MNIIFAVTIFQLRTFKTQIMDKGYRALIYHRLYDSVADWIKHTVFNMLTYCEKSSNTIRRKFFIAWPASCNPQIEPTSIPLVDCCDSNKYSGQGYVSKISMKPC